MMPMLPSKRSGGRRLHTKLVWLLATTACSGCAPRAELLGEVAPLDGPLGPEDADVSTLLDSAFPFPDASLPALPDASVPLWFDGGEVALAFVLCSDQSQVAVIVSDAGTPIALECFFGLLTRTEQIMPRNREPQGATACGLPAVSNCCLSLWPCDLAVGPLDATTLCPLDCLKPAASAPLDHCPAAVRGERWRPVPGAPCTGSFICDEFGVSLVGRQLDPVRYLYWCAAGALQRGGLSLTGI